MDSYYLLMILIVAGILAGLEPLVIAVFAALLSSSKGKEHSKSRQLLGSITFIASHAIIICLLGLFFTGLFSLMSYELLASTALAVATLAVLWGLARVKNYYWYGPFGGIPKSIKKLLHKHTTKTEPPFSAMILALSTSAASLINTVVFIGGFAVLLVLLKPGEPKWIVFYSIVLVIPLLIFYWQIHRGLRLSALVKWKEDNKRFMELSLGLLSIFLGWLIYLSLNGTLGWS